jgi:ABC-type oligopeptide transport system ATPase subunit
MAPKLLFAKKTLSYPLYAVDFDPKDSDTLVVGGGGGSGKSGVGNKIVGSAINKQGH